MIQKWCNEVGLSVNPNKTELVVFTMRRKLSGFFEPHFFWVTQVAVGRSSYRRIIPDSRLTWREHVDVKMKKAHNLLWACRRACGEMWGPRPKVVHWLNVSIIQPSITFTSLVRWPGCQMAGAKKTRSRVRRLAYLGIMGAIRTTPTGAMEALTGLPPLDLVSQGAARSAVRPCCLGCWSYLHTSRGHSSILMRFQR